MELIREEIRVETPVAGMLSAAVAEGEVCILDDMPSVDKVFCCDPKVGSVQAQAEQGSIAVTGVVEFTVVYASGAELASASARCAFAHTLSAPQVTPQMLVQVYCEPTLASAKWVHERCVAVECVVQMEAEAIEAKRMACVAKIQDENLEVNTAAVQWASLSGHSASSFTLREDVELPAGLPDMKEALLSQARVKVQDVRVRDGHALITGQLLVQILYATAIAGMPVQSADFEIPYTAPLSISELSNEMVISALGEATDLIVRGYDDASGQKRVLSIEAPILFKISAYISGKSALIHDAYGLDRDISLEKVPVTLYDVPKTRLGDVIVSGTLPNLEGSHDIGRILFVTVRPMVDSVSSTKDRAAFSGRMMTRIFYMQSEEAGVGCVEAEAPFDAGMDIAGLSSGAQLRLSTHCLQASAHRTVNGVFDIRAQLEVKTIIRQSEPGNVIVNVQEGNPVEVDNLAPLMLVMVAQGETLWAVAQRCRVPIKTLMEYNAELADRDLKPGDCLVVMR